MTLTLDRAPLGWMPPRFAYALLGVGLVGHLLIGRHVVVRAPWLGLVLAILGLWMAVGSKRRFRQLQIPLSPKKTPPRLLTDGWFSLSRNPMYVGMALVLLGVGLALGSLPALLTAPVFLAIIRRWFVPVEEENLSQMGGDDWNRYARRVPRWL